MNALFLRAFACAAIAVAVPIGAASPPSPAVRAIALDGSGKPMPRPAIVMLWATWCAACAGELRRVPALSRTTSLPFVTLAIDPADKARGAVPKLGIPIDHAFADERPIADVLGDWGGKGAILPLAVAIDRNGQICASKRGLLGTDQIRDWSRRCSQ